MSYVIALSITVIFENPWTCSGHLGPARVGGAQVRDVHPRPLLECVCGCVCAHMCVCVSDVFLYPLVHMYAYVCVWEGEGGGVYYHFISF